MTTSLKGIIGGGTTFSASPAIRLKPQIYIAKGSSPWYGRYYWKDDDKVTNIDESISGQATVTCNGEVFDMSSMFRDCDKLTSLDLSNFDTSNVTKMGYTFGLCTRLTTVDFSNLDTSNVAEMEGVFGYCASLTTIKGVIDMKSCTSYAYMFMGCRKLKDVKIKNPPAGFDGAGLSSSQYTIVS